ncbi:MAG: secondary thiamine-phosphate synthase enzyme YjbQ, partial [Actinobacteria bacterium]|nr:secondary thiamine-phosphate synthase enzyme YjbQ [Actinomycetota bacterium]
MKTEIKRLDMSDRTFLDLTSDARSFVSGQGDGLLHVFAPHATAGLALIETGSGSEQDLESILEQLLPRDHPYVHRHGSPGHGRDHVVPAFISPSVTVPVIDGDVALGTWQSIVFVDTNRDNPQR